MTTNKRQIFPPIRETKYIRNIYYWVFGIIERHPYINVYRGVRINLVRIKKLRINYPTVRAKFLMIIIGASINNILLLSAAAYEFGCGKLTYHIIITYRTLFIRYIIIFIPKI